MQLYILQSAQPESHRENKMIHVKSVNVGNVISYEGTGFDDPNWNAVDQPFADAGLSQAEYDALPNFDDVGQPWYQPPPPVLTRTEKLEQLLAQHDLTIDCLVDEIEANKVARK